MIFRGGGTNIIYRKLFKRVFDVLLSSAGIFISLPLWVIFSVTIWLEDKGPVYYLQERLGKNARPFTSIKFRSMRPDSENGLGPVQAQADDPRATKIGRFLRKTAMDELPQLWNIFKGEMSFVGPRALRPEEIERAENPQLKSVFQVPGFMARSTVRPGLTGAAQVFASRNLLREDKFKHDLWYIENLSFPLDIRLILASFSRTFRAKWDI